MVNESEPTTDTTNEGEDQEHGDVPVDLTKLHEVLDWFNACAAAGVTA